MLCMAAAGLTDSFVKQVACRRCCDEVADAPGARGLTEDCDVVWVTAELCDVLLDPAQGGDLVVDAIVTGYAVSGFCAQRFVGEKNP